MAQLISTILLWRPEFYTVDDLIIYLGLELSQVNNSTAAIAAKYYTIKQNKWK